MNTNKTKKVNFLHKIYSVTGIFLLSCLILVYILVLPTINEIKNLKKDILNQKIELEKKMSREKNKTKLNESLRKIEPEIGLLDNAYITINKELEFITLLEGIADKHKIEQILNLKIEESKNLSSHKVIPLNISIEGKYPNVMEYMKSIESLHYYININAINLLLPKLTATGNSVSDNIFKAQQNTKLSIEANTFWK